MVADNDLPRPHEAKYRRCGPSPRPAPRREAGEPDEPNTGLGLVGHQNMVNDLHFNTAKGLAVAQAFKAQRGDVLISTFAKTGTTWMQQLCHQLRTGGDEDFDEISEEQVVPWLEVSPSLGIDVDLPQVKTNGPVVQPRCFKTHQPLRSLSHLEDHGAKFLCTIRDPEATMKSWFRFMLLKNHASAASRDINAFVRSSFNTPGGEGHMAPPWGADMWTYYVEYWLCRKLPNVCVIAYGRAQKGHGTYADMVADLRAMTGTTCSPGPQLDAHRAESGLDTVLRIVGHQMMVNNSKFCTAKGLAAAQAFEARPGDVLISTFAKTGTTWMQQICHQLRTGGDEDFEEISEEQAHGAKFLCTVRDPEATMKSWFRFLLSKSHGCTASRDINDFVTSSFNTPGGHGDWEPLWGVDVWTQYTEYWLCRKLPNVRVIAYEHLRKDFDGELKKIADFLDIDLTPDLQERVRSLSSMDWMAKHEHMFDDHTMPQRLGRIGGEANASKFVMAKKLGLGTDDLAGGAVNDKLDDVSRDFMAAAWRRFVTAVTGHDTYADMIADL